MEALVSRNLFKDYNRRPDYQKNDYIGWICSAKRAETQEKRLKQMLDELAKGGVYMKMSHPASEKNGAGAKKSHLTADRDGAAEVNDYIDGLPGDIREAIQNLRESILSIAPACTERIAYGMPVFRMERDLCGIQVHKNFCSFYTMDIELASRVGKRFPKLEVSSSSIRFYPGKPLPEEAVRMVLKERLSRS